MACQEVIKITKGTFGFWETLQGRKEMHSYKNVISLLPLSIFLKKSIIKELNLTSFYLIFSLISYKYILKKNWVFVLSWLITFDFKK